MNTGLTNRFLPTIAGLLVGIAMAMTGCGRSPRAQGPLVQDAYVWQRDWNSNVVSAVAAHGPRFHRLVALGAEMGWRSGQPRITRIPFTFPKTNPGPVGVALRVGPFPGPFATNDGMARRVVGTARALVEEARGAGLDIAELQLDFDCAESRLNGYRLWVEALVREVAPVPVVITALPSWLKRREFAPLARAAGGFVLQVHSIARPRSATEPFALCDPDAALRQVEQAGRVGVPFRVALPTYGYLVAFGPDGAYLGASAEGPPPDRPAGTRLRELSADPASMARLMRIWAGDRPESMRGVIWYRLPVPGDRLNWRWPTLASVMEGREPRSKPEVLAKSSQPGLVEIELVNPGDGDFRGALGVRGNWEGARLLGSDGIRGFSVASAGSREILFTNSICRLPAEGRVPIGWVRFDTEVPTRFEIVAANELP